MRMNLAVLTAVAVLAVALASPLALAGNSKYAKKPKEVAAEKAKGLADCNTFAAGFKVKGKAAAHADFNKQFGEGAKAGKGATEYNYDKYTKISLKCAKKACSAMCLQK